MVGQSKSKVIAARVHQGQGSASTCSSDGVASEGGDAPAAQAESAAGAFLPGGPVTYGDYVEECLDTLSEAKAAGVVKGYAVHYGLTTVEIKIKPNFKP